MYNRVFNFSAGPSVLPVEVIEKVQSELLNYQGSGQSIMEMSHRSKEFVKVMEDAEKDLREILEIPEVVSASFYRMRDYADGIYYQDKSMDGGKVLGIDSDYLDTCGYQLVRGRGFNQKEYVNFKKVALLDETAANSFFEKGEELGKTI